PRRGAEGGRVMNFCGVKGVIVALASSVESLASHAKSGSWVGVLISVSLCLSCDPGDPSICGVVTRCDTGEPIVGVKVVLTPDCRSSAEVAYSGQEGRYCSNKCGDAEVSFEKPGYVTEQPVMSHSTTTLDVCLEVDE